MPRPTTTAAMPGWTRGLRPRHRRLQRGGPALSEQSHLPERSLLDARGGGPRSAAGALRLRPGAAHPAELRVRAQEPWARLSQARPAERRARRLQLGPQAEPEERILSLW